MPRTGGVYAPPAGTKGTPNTTIQSSAYNALVDDITLDANSARPVTAGGTGATNATDARSNIGAQKADNFLTSISGLTGALGKFLLLTGPKSAVVSDIVGQVSQTGGVPDGALSEAGANANGSYARFANGLQVTWGTQVVNANVAPGVSYTFVPTQPAGFNGEPFTVGKLSFFTGANSLGTELYGAPFTRFGAFSLLALQTGRVVSAVEPAFSIGGNAAQSVLAHFISVGRWF